jgi:multimeric flavodoxin WrbA
MKIVGLCASPRENGNTQRLLQRFMLACERLGAQTEIYSTTEHRVEFCRACEQCMRRGTCPIQDDYLPILPKILEADAIVLATPNYAFDVSAQFKAVMDRSHAFLYYAQALKGKYGVGLCVAGHWAMTKKIAKWCAQAVWLCGGSYVGYAWGISKVRDKKGFVNEAKVYAQTDHLAKKLVNEIRKKKKHPIQAWFRETFIVSKLRRGFIRRRAEYPWIAEQCEK